jgi:hypothetical protein
MLLKWCGGMIGFDGLTFLNGSTACEAGMFARQPLILNISFPPAQGQAQNQQRLNHPKTDGPKAFHKWASLA